MNNAYKTRPEQLRSMCRLYDEKFHRGEKVLCPICNCEITRRDFANNELHACHLRPASLFGKAEHGNLVLGHRKCNITNKNEVVPLFVDKYIYW